MPPTLSRKTLISGLRIFLIFTLAGFTLLFYLTGTKETISALQHFQPLYLLLAFLLIGMDYCLGAGRIFIFIRKMGNLSDIKYFVASFKANLANIFMAAVTPFQTGGGLAQLYMLHRDSIPVSGALSAGVLNYVATLTFLVFGGLFSFKWLRETYADFQFQFIFSFSTIIFYLVAIIAILFLFFPLPIGRILQKLLAGIGSLWKKKRNNFIRYSEKILDFINHYRSHISYFWKNEKPILLLNIGITFLLFFNKCLVAFVILKGMGLSPDFTTVIAIQILLIFIIYFCPTPGASFLAETSAAALMSVIIPKHYLPVFSILWRFFLTYFGVIIGGVILLKAISTTGESE